MPLIKHYIAALEKQCAKVTEKKRRRAQKKGLDSIEMVVWAPLHQSAFLAAGWHPQTESFRDGHTEMTMRLDTRP